MAKPPATEITFPISRFVQGSLTEPNTKDADGNLLITKNGPDQGKPRLDFFFAFAIPKTANVPWWQEPWGQLMYNVGLAAFGQQVCASPSFAWKLRDGDSQVPNSKGNKPCDQEGFPGHWIISTSSGFPPSVHTANGSAMLADPRIVKPGHYIQVAANVTSNESNTKPGIYINHSMVAHSGYGPEIQLSARDASKAGFGQGPAPAGMSAVPVQQAQFPGQPMPGAAQPGAPMAGPGPGAYPAPQQPQPGPGGYPQPGAQPGAYPQPGAQPQQLAVQPNPAAMGGMPGAQPGPGPQAAMPGAYPQPGMQPAARDLNARRAGAALANNWDLNAMVAGGWRVEDLVAQGHATPY